MDKLLHLAESGKVPDAMLREGVRMLLRKREASMEEDASDPRFLQSLREGPVALFIPAAEKRPQALPPAFYGRLLGPRLKHSCCFFARGDETLAAAEEAMLKLTCDRAEIADGMDILDLGCGWGSLSLWIAERYPAAHVTAVSGSAAQGAFVRDLAARQGLSNLRVEVCDINTFAPEGQFDRCVSVEAFERLRNWRELFSRAAGWIRPEGRLFLHVFCHEKHAYPYVTGGEGRWLAEHFLAGGMMPSYDLAPRMAAPDFHEEERWMVNGLHYHHTSMRWLENMDRNREAILAVFEEVYGAGESRLWWHRWRLFHIACAELFGWRTGAAWFVGHYLFKPQSASR